MASVLNFTLNGPASINRDAKVELTHQATGKKLEVAPYLDGTASVRGLADGAWTMRVTHPNFTFPLVTRDIRVLPDRPTIIPIVIPANLLTFTAIQDVPDANLGPVQVQLDAAKDVAARQAQKKGGEPIYAADWNELSSAAADVATAAGQMTRLVSPMGHNHPELEGKLAEVDSNLQKFFDIFGRSVVELQRQIQQLALQRKLDDALNAAKVPVDAPVRATLNEQAIKLLQASQDPPAVYTRKAQEVGRLLEAAIAAVPATPTGEGALQLKAAAEAAGALSAVKTVLSYREEAEGISRLGTQAGLNFHGASKG